MPIRRYVPEAHRVTVMHALRIGFLFVALIAGSGCASRSAQVRPSLDDMQVVAANDIQVPDADALSDARPLADAHAVSPPGEDAAVIEEDLALVYGDAEVWDPWEKQNRRVHRFNTVVDAHVLRPLARAYTRALPARIRAGVTRFFRNLGEPANAINHALQGHPGHSLATLGRFALNTTLGVGGVFDPASRMGLRRRDEEDVGQTLGTWGWRRSRYLVLPLLGPRTVRDTLSLVADQRVAPLRYVNDGTTALALQALEVVDGRTQLAAFDDAREDAYDDYAFVRDAWSQRRVHQIERDAPSE
ncbi:ABC-type transporter Mla maintaining outer membrane lipid asymmetry, lipoprotein component MlaA [Pseudoxanthomonas sp. CF385]|nr:ABC-type transporter Mla maintaining outer membrane lipid asymmetry, lipoprotein component MlaA [Pseudoxanthomonas sp. CF385]